MLNFGFKKNIKPTPSPQTTVIGPPPPPSPMPEQPKTFMSENKMDSSPFKTQYLNAIKELGTKFLVAAEELDEWELDKPSHHSQSILKWKDIFNIKFESSFSSGDRQSFLTISSGDHVIKNYRWDKATVPANTDDPFINAYLSIREYILHMEEEQKYANKLLEIQDILGRA